MTEIARELKRRHPSVPLMVFPRGASYALADLQTAGFDVVTVDTLSDLNSAVRGLRSEAARTGTRIAAVQGNLDPRLLRAQDGGTVEDVRQAVRNMLDAVGPFPPGFIANLGEGLSGSESPELVAA